MTAAARTLAALRASLAAALPGRIHSPDFVDHPRRQPAELEKGVVTVLMPDIQPDDWQSNLSLKVVGQVQVHERSSLPHDVEAAELALYSQLVAWLRNPGAGVPRLQARAARFSSQMEFPYGWVALDVSCGPIDDAAGDDGELYPPNLQPGHLSGTHIDIDLSPHETREEHHKWLNGDYRASQPELTLETKHAADQAEAGR
ncbi:hypothetical protein CEK28_04825 [Xenophilus sp. AP218F]|nr:hypothetical protein CEK28_04825 [Xenophilus sp. AP218F]